MTADPDSGAERDPADPAPMRLGGEPPRATRISRKALAILGAVSGLAIGGALVYALQSGGERGRAQDELYTTERRMPADGIHTLPRDYGDVPRLGPALPGDLGRPIVDAQNRGRPVPAPGIGPAPGVDPDEQRRLQELEAARVSALFADAGGRAATPAAGSPQAGSLPEFTPLGLTPDPAAFAADDRSRAFLDAEPDRRTVAPDRIAPPASPYLLQAGSVIPAALITGIRSDLPGQVAAQVTENVYDSPTGRILLIPQGARLIGEYDSAVTTGQRRVLLVWTRLIFPDGRSIVLEREPGADAEGFAGLQDRVDHRWGAVFRAAGLSTLLAIGAELAMDDEDRLVRALRAGAQGTISQAGQEIVRRQLSVPPTLAIRPGFPVRVMVRRDLVLEPTQG